MTTRKMSNTVAAANSGNNNNNATTVEMLSPRSKLNNIAASLSEPTGPRTSSVSFSVGDSESENEMLLSSHDVFDGENGSGNAMTHHGAATRHHHQTNGICWTFLHFMKGNLGTGILAMPDAIKNAGLLFGSAGIIVIGILSTYCCHLLLRAYRRVSNRPMSYADVAEIVFRRAGSTHHPLWQRLAIPARHFVNALLLASQIGFCSVYVKFCGRMAKEVAEDYFETAPRGMRFYETFILLFLIPYCCVKTLKGLAVYSMAANAMTTISLVIVMQHVFRNLQPLNAVPWGPQSFGTVPLFFGTAMFTFESIALILPIENSMKDRAKFHGWKGLLSVSMFVVVTLYVIVGFYGYLAFGKDSQMILSNLPRKSSLYSLVKWMYAVSILISYNLQLYVPVQILQPPIQKSRLITSNPVYADLYSRYGEYALRIAIVIFTYICAVYIQCLEFMISLFGAFAASWLALILPPIIELVSSLGHHHSPSSNNAQLLLSRKRLFKCGAICFVGLFGCIVGTAVSLHAIINALEHPEACAI